MRNRFLSVLLAVLLLSAALLSSGMPSAAFGRSAETPLPSGVYTSWKQLDPRWCDVVIGVDPWTDSSGVRHRYETVGHAGCLISSLAILAKAYGLSLADGTGVTPGTLAEALYDNGSCTYLTEGGAFRYSHAFEALVPGLSFVSKLSFSSAAKTVAEYLNDPDHHYVIIAGVKSNRHFVAVDHVSSDGKTVYICDPGYDCTTLSSYTCSSLILFEIDGDRIREPSDTEEGDPWKVITETKLRIRTGPGLDFSVKGNYLPGSLLSVTDTAESDGYLWGRTVDGWTALRSTDGTEIYAVRLEDSQHPVYLHENTGSGRITVLLKAEGDPLTLPETAPVYEGLRFLGWATDPGAVSSDYALAGTLEEDGITDLYAVWMESSALFGFGVDVSSHQKEIDWKTAAESGVTFAIIRAGTSKGTDTCFERNYAGAKEAGVLVGCYFYCYAQTEKELKSDLKAFKALLDGKQWDLPVYVDIESKAQSSLGIDVLSGFVSTAMAYLDENGYYGGVYSSEEWFRTLIRPESAGGIDHIWMARWTESGTLSQNVSGMCSLYQYSDQGHIDGIPARVDLDVLYKDFTEEIRNSGKNGFPKPEDPGPEPDPPAGEIVQEENYFIGGHPGMTVDEWISCFPASSDIALVGEDGEPLPGDALLKTGLTVRYGDTEGLTVLPGDLNGDGKVTATDYGMAKRTVLGTFFPESAYYRAGCIGESSMTARSYTKIKRHVLHTLDLFAPKAEERESGT